jgi:hypothetical protein
MLIVQGHVRAEGTPSDLLSRFDVASLEDLYLDLTTEKE